MSGSSQDQVWTPVKLGAIRADLYCTMTSRALALLAAFASPVFIVAATAGWLTGTWPATPLTLFVAAVAAIGGPLLGLVHVATADEDEDAVSPAPALVLAPAPRARRGAPDAIGDTPRLTAARRFHSWRDRPNETLTMREREEHFRRNQRLARQLRRAGRV
jgi:hypothetical protein